jgi:F420-non-reducing hydrogenase iron-sulfur subunit
MQYSPEMRLIRVMCTGRVDMEFIIRSFQNGADGVFIGGCKLGECNYITGGNFQTLNMVLLMKKILKYIGVNPDRLRMNFMSSGDAMAYVEYVNSFIKKIKELGPLGKGEGMDEKVLKSRLDSVKNLIPYIRLVERERIRVKFDSEEKAHAFFDSEEAETLFRETIGDKLTISEIMTLLKNNPLTSSEIAQALNLNPSAISKHLNYSAKQGLVKFDQKEKRYARVA